MTPDVVVLGSLNLDLVVEVAQLPRPGETRLGRGHRQECGGKGANQAVAVARAGAAVAMVGAVGDDAGGALLLDSLAGDGVHTASVTRTTASTGMAMIMVSDDGENLIAVSPGANSEVGAAEVATAAQLLTEGSVLLCQLEIPLATVLDAAGRARHAGARVVVNPSPVPVEAADRADLERLLPMTDVLVVNETEARALSGVEDGSQRWPVLAADQLRRRGSRAVVVTLGGAGAWVVDADGARHVPALPTTAVDAVAAGDSFLGALVCELSRGGSLAAAARVGSAAGALAVSRHGAQASIPHRDEIDALLAAHPDPAGA